MPDTDHEPRGTLNAGSSHALAGRMAWPAAGFVLFGLAVLLVGEGSPWPGLALIGIGGVLLVVVAVRLSQPPVDAIALNVDGIVFRDVSTRVIPWSEIRSVRIGRVREISAPTTREVATIAVSRAFFATLSTKIVWPQEVVEIGDPTLIHLAYHRHDVSARDLAARIEGHLAGPLRASGEVADRAGLEPDGGRDPTSDPGGGDATDPPGTRSGGNAVKTILFCALGITFLLFVFGPVLGLRETGSQIRSRNIQEDHERRMKETLDRSERERRRSEEDLERSRKEIFGDR